MIRFTTENSTYEVDTDSKQIRRLSGTSPHTPRQSADGTWKSYQSISEIAPGARVLVMWQGGQGTLLSETQTVEPMIF